MPVVISMLRGVNLGGHNKLKMAALRELYGSLGLREPQTYVQSGNVVFRTQATDLAPLARRIEEAIERKFSFRPSVIFRTCADMRDVLSRNPFAKRHGIEAGKLLVTFLPAKCSLEARREIGRINTGPEDADVQIDGRELYMYFPYGVGRSKVWPAIEKALKKSGTSRNWNTVVKLLEIAEEKEASHSA